jgi:hypothetical protein
MLGIYKELFAEEASQMANHIKPHWTSNSLQKSIRQHETRNKAMPIDEIIISEAVSKYHDLVVTVQDRSTLNRRKKWFEPRIISDIARAYAQKTLTHSLP